MKGKLIIFSAPSGSGKTTIVKRLLQNEELNLEFSISACTRPQRDGEINGVDYYFLSKETFLEKIEKGEFVEWEEVYKDHYYGTLNSEIERIRNNGRNVIFDIDVEGGLNLKNIYEREALAVFVMPPSMEELEKRLINRSLDESFNIKIRIEKAKAEMKYANRFDVILYNDDLERAVGKAEEIIRNFLHS
jgi:guanylate kinase